MRPLAVLLVLAACDPSAGPDDVDTDTDTDTIPDTDPVTDTDSDTPIDTDTDPIVAQPMDVTITPEAPFAGEALTCAAASETPATYTWTLDGEPSSIISAEVPVGRTDAYQTWACTALTVDGRFTGTASVDVAETCKAFLGDGVSSLITIGPGPSTQYDRVGDDFTIEMWAWRATTGVAHQLVSHAGALDPSPARTDYALAYTADDQLTFVTGPADDGCATLTVPAPSAEAWHHIAASYTASNNRKRVFIDGLLAGTCVSSSRPASSPGSFNLGGAFTLPGASAPNGVSQAFDGYLDEVRLSAIERYSVPFVPETYHRPDADTLVLLHLNDTFEFNAQSGVQTRTPDVSRVAHPVQLAFGASLSDVHSSCEPRNAP